jgi:hypothetical protein
LLAHFSSVFKDRELVALVFPASLSFQRGCEPYFARPEVSSTFFRGRLSALGFHQGVLLSLPGRLASPCQRGVQSRLDSLPCQALFCTAFHFVNLSVNVAVSGGAFYAPSPLHVKNFLQPQHTFSSPAAQAPVSTGVSARSSRVGRPHPRPQAGFQPPLQARLMRALPLASSRSTPRPAR